MAVLVRAWKRAPAFAEALRAEGFAVIVGGGDFLGRPEVLLVRALLAAIANPRDEQALVTVLASPLGGVSASALWELARSGAERGRPVGGGLPAAGGGRRGGPCRRRSRRLGDRQRPLTRRGDAALAR